MRDITYNEIQLVRVYLKGFCPSCAAKGIKSKLVHCQITGAGSGMENYCHQCHEVWPSERVQREFFEKIIHPDILQFSRGKSKIPSGILPD